MSDSTGEPERLAEVLREIIALSQTGRPNSPRVESKNEIEGAGTNESMPGSSESLEKGNGCRRE